MNTFRVIAILWVMLNHTGSEGRIDILERLPSAEQFKANVHQHPLFGALLGNSALGVEVRSDDFPKKYNLMVRLDLPRTLRTFGSSILVAVS